MPSTMPTETAATSSRIGCAASLPAADQFGQRVVQGDAGAADRGAAGAAVGLYDVAIERDLAFAECAQIGHRAQAAADQALDFLGAAGLLALGRLAVGAGVGRARQHAVFGGDPAADPCP
jgi:hypothetical protein